MFLNNTYISFLLCIPVVFSFVVIISKNPVHSILSLIFVFFNISGIFILLEVEFLALLFIIVYVGAVAVLFLFVVMMLNIKLVSLSISMYRYIPLFCIFGFLFFLEFVFIFNNDFIFVSIDSLFLLLFHKCSFYNSLLLNWKFSAMSPLNLIIFSKILYTRYVCFFFISGIVLLTSMIGCISLTLHRRNDIKRQFVYKQIYRNFIDSVTWKT